MICCECIRDVVLYWHEITYFISLMVLLIWRVEDDRSSRTRLTKDHASRSAGALSTPVQGIICPQLVWIYLIAIGCRTNNSAISLGGLVVLVNDQLDPGCFSGAVTISNSKAKTYTST